MASSRPASSPGRGCPGSTARRPLRVQGKLASSAEVGGGDPSLGVWRSARQAGDVAFVQPGEKWG